MIGPFACSCCCCEPSDASKSWRSAFIQSPRALDAPQELNEETGPQKMTVCVCPSNWAATEAKGRQKYVQQWP
jgi:hypothetical protein